MQEHNQHITSCNFTQARSLLANTKNYTSGRPGAMPSLGLQLGLSSPTQAEARATARPTATDTNHVEYTLKIEKYIAPATFKSKKCVKGGISMAKSRVN